MSLPLVQRLGRGAQGDDSDLRERLGLEGPIDDARLTAELVKRLADDEIIPRNEWTAPPPKEPESPAPVQDLRSVIAVLKSGTLSERRRAALRLGALLRGDDPSSELSGAELATLDEALSSLRDLDAGHELLVARRALPGAAGQEVRDEDASAHALFTRLEEEIRTYWEGERDVEPLENLPAEEIALLAPRLREASDAFVAHLSALLEGTDGSLTIPSRKALLSAFRHAGDPRLVPALAQLLAAKERELATGAARALGRIEDPRVRAILARAYRTSVRPNERAVIAGALGLHGDMTGRAWVRALSSNADPSTLKAALEAMASLGQPEDAERLAVFVTHDDVEVVLRAVRALGRTGDARALLVLARLRTSRRQEPLDGALVIELEDAESAITARLELRGEEVPARSEALTRSALSTAARQAIERSDARPMPSWWGRFRAFTDWIIARLWIAAGVRERALRRLELAALRRPGWAPPLVTLGASYPPVQSAHALAALRRALEADRAWVERHAARLLARVFLRRAEETARDGRADIARGLIEEALRLDLRRAPSSLRVELTRRLDTLRGDGA